MDAEQISIVIPVYNAQRCIDRCIESVLAQSYTFFELILVDDGSADSSWSILQRYALADERVKIAHQSNRGASAARNMGISRATGKYLCFVDADDWVEVDYLHDLLAGVLSQEGAGLVVQGLKGIDGSGTIVRPVDFPERILVGMEMGKAFTQMALYESGYSASKLYCLPLLNQHGIRFDEQVAHAEDLLFMIDYLKQVHYIHFGAKSNYIYDMSDSSLSRSNRSYWSEKGCYEQMKQNLLDLSGLFQLSVEDLAPMREKVCQFLGRALPAMFRPPHALTPAQRRRELALLTTDDLTLLKNYYHPWRLTERWGKQLLLHRQWWLYERYMSFLFWVRYRVLVFRSGG